MSDDKSYHYITAPLLILFQELSCTSFIYCVGNIFWRLWIPINMLTIVLCLFWHCTLFSFAEVTFYLIFCYRSATTSLAPPREQTKGARNLSALEREATPPRSPTPDQTSQVRTNYGVLKILKRRQGYLKVNHHSLSLSNYFILVLCVHATLGLNQL